MKLVSRFFYLFLFILCSIDNLYSQNENLYTIPDSLLNKTDAYLLEQAQKNHNDTTKIIIYYSSLLTKATINNDTIKRVQVLSYLSYFEKERKRKIDLIETALSEAEGKQNPGLISTYNTAGLIYYNLHEYENALKQYLKALDISEKHNSSYKYVILKNIAEIKLEIGKYQEALQLYKKTLAQEISKSHKDSLTIATVKASIAESMRFLKKYDSASYYNKQIIDNPFNHPFSEIYVNIATINEGINLFYKHDYVEAKRKLQQGSSQLSFNTINEKYYILSLFYLGKINSILSNDEIQTETYFQKVDSLLTVSNRIIPETKEIYSFFIKKHEAREEFQSQIKAINKLITYDSIINIRKLNTVNKLHSEFDIPELLKNKEIAFQKLENKNLILNNRALYLVLLIFMLLFLFIFQHKKHKKRFNNLMKNAKLETRNIKPLPTTKKVSKEINIDKKIIDQILNQLEHFEKKHLYRKSSITINSLAKTFSTNTLYLSKVINIYKQKKFTHYINDLRIDYILEELKRDTLLQQYTIKSVAKEAGFKTPESFVTAFKKKTGIKPSYFIRNIKKKEVISRNSEI